MKAFLVEVTQHFSMEGVNHWSKVQRIVYADTFENAEKKVRKHLTTDENEVLKVSNLTIE